MQRDIDLMRKILLAIESSEEYMSFNTIDELAQKIDEDNDEYFRYQLRLMLDEKLFWITDIVLGKGYSDFGIYQLTSKGCAVLDGIRTDELCNALKKAAGKAGMQVTVGLILKFLGAKLDL